jgi:hypothetical protein
MKSGRRARCWRLSTRSAAKRVVDNEVHEAEIHEVTTPAAVVPTTIDLRQIRTSWAPNPASSQSDIAEEPQRVYSLAQLERRRRRVIAPQQY